MRTLVLTIIPLILSCITVYAQEWNMPWIHHPHADSTQQLWFKKMLTLKERPQTASIYVVSCGRYIVYINGYNVTTDLLEPLEIGGIMFYDVGRFIREGTNTVSVWYSPIPPCHATNEQLALSLCLTINEGKHFAFETDETWLCRQANATTTPDGDETIDSANLLDDWGTNVCNPTDWQVAECSTRSMAKRIPLQHESMHISRIQSYSYLDDYGQTIVYNFAKRFNGWIRLTLRDMQRGDTISVNGLTYICSGEDDEQACRRFTTTASSIAIVTGPKGFSRNNITNIEAICIEPYLHRSYLY